jgi:L-iditol 2-dehydrogenase
VPDVGEVLLQVTAVGLCGSDRHCFLEGGIGGTPIDRPLVLGHEIAGVIRGTPRDGQRVALDPAIPCGTCGTCRSGDEHLCPDVRFAGVAPTDGALRTWLAWPESRCVTLPDAIDDRDAPLLEVLGIAFHAIDLGAVEPGMTVGVYGCGPIGLVLIRALRSVGVDRIVASDPNGHRVAEAQRSGATTIVLVPFGGLDPAATIQVDVAFECAGADAALATALHAVRPGGRVLILGIPTSSHLVVPAAVARRKELSLQMVRRMRASDLPRAIGVVRTGDVSFDRLVTHVFQFDSVHDAFRVLEARSGIKVVVEPT